MIKPFSILDTRTKEWQDRKRWWTNTYKIKSELGRENTMPTAATAAYPPVNEKKNAISIENGQQRILS